MKFKFSRSNIKRIILLFIFWGIISLSMSKTYASTIENSNISVHIDLDGVCHIEETLNITAIGEATNHINESKIYYPSMKLTRGENIENLYTNNLEVSDYYNKWGSNEVIDYIISSDYDKVDSYYNPGMTNNENDLKGYYGPIKLYYPCSR